MLTSYITTKNMLPLSTTYVHDENFDFLSKEINVDGNLNYVETPILSATNDFANNNYSALHLTRNVNLANLTDFAKPENPLKILFGTLSIVDTFGVQRFLEFSDQRDDILTESVYFDQTFSTPFSGITDLNFFEFDFTDPNYCTVAHLYRNAKFFLCFDPAKAGFDNDKNLNFLQDVSFNNQNDYTRKFFYNYDENNNLLTLQVRSVGVSYQIYVNNARLNISQTNNISFDYNNSIFTLSTYKYPTTPELTVEWGSYQRGYNQNSLEIDENRSFFNLTNNFLVNSEYYNIKATDLPGKKLPANLLTLKNQLNIKNDQGRGGVFLDEPEVNYREYNLIGSGGHQEKGYNTLQLGYECYTTPFTMLQGKTNWFHMPLNMYPYSRLNVADTTLVKSGAIAGDHPLRSDKIFKKIANYQKTSNQGDSTGEQTGQWLCTWLSGGPDINTQPVWVDRYYNPTTTTLFVAMSTRPSNTTIIESLDCVNLEPGVSDIPSSLTFEPGCWYAYSHIGKSDAEQNIKSLKEFLLTKDFNSYSFSDGTNLDPVADKDNFQTYEFSGKQLAYVDVSNFNYDRNEFTFAFWAYSDNWNRPMGYELAGNYNDYGMGIFNYNFVTPVIFYKKEGTFVGLNRDLEILNTYNSGVSSFGNLSRIIRRDALNSFHVFTDRQVLLEYDLKETLVDATTALSGTAGDPVFTSNDEFRGYFLYKGGVLKAVDLFSNLLIPISSTVSIGVAASAKEVAKLLDGSLALIDGTQTQVFGSFAYFLSSGNVFAYNTNSLVLSSFIGDSSNKYECFSIDKYSSVWTASGNLIQVFDSYGTLQRGFYLSADSSFSSTPIKIKNITFLENFDSGVLMSDVLISASGSNTGYILIYRMNYDGTITKTKKLQTNSDILLTPDPANHRYNYSYLKNRYGVPGFTFKLRLYNPLNNEDVSIPQITIAASDLNSGYHHFACTLNTVEGNMKLYLDGKVYAQSTFTPYKYAFTKLLTDRIYVGTTPFYGGLALHDFLDKTKTNKTSYMCKGFDVQNFYLYKKELDYFDINMLYKHKLPPRNLVWDVPSGKRNFIDSVSRFFKNKIPGRKSEMYNLIINNNTLSKDSQELLNIAILHKLRDTAPAYTKLNAIQWYSNRPSISSDYASSYFPGNTLTTGELLT